MSFLNLCQQIQSTWLSEAISQSTWGYPAIGAFHVLAMALTGGFVLVSNLNILGDETQVRALKWTGITFVVLTGILLFVSNPVRYYSSKFFQFKLLLLLLLVINAVCSQIWQKRSASYVSLALWIGVIFAARGIAFF